MNKRGEWILLAALAVEIAIFAAIGQNFFTLDNFFEVIRFSVELGLLSIAMTPVMVTGGIDLSVGSMMGLAAVVFGVTVKGWHLPAGAGVLAALAVGWAGGALNAGLISRLKLPPLIVTLGTYSMYRGIAEGITRGAVNYTDFPSSFLYLGQGYFGGLIPVQVPIFILVAMAYAILLHRSVIGRALYAIGFGESGARYAGIPVAKRISLVYVLSGIVSSLAAIIYVAHLGQAKSSAGDGYELDAITAVVLGGTSVFGGRGTLGGTLLGLFFLSVLQNGLHLAALPSELTGVLTGVLLVLIISFDRWRHVALKAGVRPGAAVESVEESDEVKNSQVAILCGAVIAGALIVAVTNVWMVKSLAPRAGEASSSVAPSSRKPVIAVMPKAKGDPYFVSVRGGAEEAAKELGIDMIWDGPTGLDAAKQNEMVENWITRKVDAIAVAVENKGGISTVLKKARERGIKVITWDADAEKDARDFLVNQATSEGIANTLTDAAAKILNGKGDFAIITGALTANNQNEWIAFIKKRLAKYPGLNLITIRPSDDDRDKAFAETQTLLKVYPNVKLMMAISAPAVPGSAEAVKQAGRKDVAVIGLSLPSICKTYIHEGWVPMIALWNTRDLGYLAVRAADQAVTGQLKPGATSMDGGRLGKIEVRGDEIILGAPLVIDKKNVDSLDF
ncbi:MAG TPA: substrate-binding domain-containing protein [Bryobacteraceae bacterium]|nr:substrate-binding domain-containing protein [Bryobacteraceae bacterium]